MSELHCAVAEDRTLFVHKTQDAGRRARSQQGRGAGGQEEQV